MKTFTYFLLSLSFIAVLPLGLVAQSDVCGISASTLTVGATCTFAAGTTVSLSTNDPFSGSCSGNDDDDGWYKFVATTAETIINVSEDSGFDFAVAVLSDCSTEISCVDNASSGMESIVVTTTAGSTYYIYLYEQGTGGGTFTICVSEGITCVPSVTPTDDCASAPLINSFENFCGSTAGFTVGISHSPGCGISINNDSWLRFVPSATTVEIDWYIPYGTTCDDGVQFQIYSGSCGSLSAVSGTCVNPTGGAGSGGTWTINGLSIGSTYYIMIDGYAGDNCNYYFNATQGIQTACDADAGTWN